VTGFCGEDGVGDDVMMDEVFFGGVRALAGGGKWIKRIMGGFILLVKKG